MSSPRHKSIQQNALGWVKKSIDDTLGTSESDLKLYIENRDSELIADVISRLQTLQGVLVMIEQFGAAMLTEEMVSLAQFVESNTEEQTDSALEVLLRAVLQLPDYLEHIQSGQQDNPIVILPILNDIRAVRNQDLFSEKLLFLPDLSMHEDTSDAEEITKEQNEASKLLVKKVRPLYQMALLNLIKEQAVEDNLKKMARVFETLEEKASVEQTARIWWIISALLESLVLQQLELGVSVKNLLGKVDALFRVMLIIGEQGLLKRQPIDLIKNFLYYIGQPECDGPKAQAIKTAYRLEQFLPTEAARSRTLEKIAGPNQALLKTVAEAIKVDIETVKSTLEVYVNSDLSNVSELKTLPDDLRVISDTLAMIGLGPQRQLIKEQIEIVEQILSGDSEASDNQLLTIAGDMLQIEQALDHLQRNRLQEDAGAIEVDEHEADEYEMEEVLASVVTAALDNIQRSKDSILDFIQDSSSDEKIKACLPLLEEAKGAMRMLNQQKAVTVIDDLLRYLTHCDIVDFMEASRLDALSQVVASIEYYLEALGEHRNDAENILEFAEAQMEHLLGGVTIDEATADEEMDLEVVDDKDETPTEADLEVALQVDDAELDEVTVEEVDEREPDTLSAEDLSEVLQTGEVESLELEIESPAEPSTASPAETTDSRLMELERLANEPEPTEITSSPAAGLDSPFTDEIELETLQASPAAAEPPLEPASLDAVEIGQPADEAEIEELEIEALPADDNASTEETDNSIEPDSLPVEESSPFAAEVAVETVNDDAAAMDQFADAGDIEELEYEALPADDIPTATRTSDIVEPGSQDTADADQAAEIEQLDGAADELKIDFDDAALDQEAEEAVLESHDEYASPMELLAEQAANQTALREAGELPDTPETVQAPAAPEEVETIAVPETVEAPQTVEAQQAVEAPETVDLAESVESQQAVAAPEEFETPEAFEAQQVAEAPEIVDVPDSVEVTEAAAAAEMVEAPGAVEAEAVIEVDQLEDDLVGADEIAAVDDLGLDTALDEFEVPAELEAEAEAELEPELAAEPEPIAMDAEIASIPEFEAEPAVPPGLLQQPSGSVPGAAAPTNQVASAVPEVVPVDGNEVVLKPDVDQDILEIYLEEADEEAQNILDAHQKWKANADDHEALSDIRRAFHTIKGSGRLVGAVKIGEFAWDYENLLNRVIDRSLPVSDGIIDAVGKAGAALTELVTELKGGGSPRSDIPYLRGLARSLLDVEPPPPMTVKESIEAIQQPSEPEDDGPAIEATVLVEAVPAEDELEPIEADITPDEISLPSQETEVVEDFETLPPLEEPDQPAAEVEVPHDPFGDPTSPHRLEDGVEADLSTPPEPTGGTDLSFDPDLLKIYQQEVEQHLSTLSSGLRQAIAMGELIPSEPLYRCLHTIHGASRTADISTMAELAALMEKPLKSAATQQLALDREAIQLFSEGHQALHDMTEELVQTRSLPEVPADLRDRLQAFAEDIEEHTLEVPEDQAPSGDFVDTLSMMVETEDDDPDNELLMIFIDEANELLEISDSTYDHWSKNKDAGDFTEVMELQRYLHTLKGGARMANLHEISDLSHEMESVFIAVIDGRIQRDDELLRTMRSAFDLLHSQVDAAENNSALPDPVTYVDNMKRLRLGDENLPKEKAPEKAEVETPVEPVNIVAENLGSREHVPEQPARDVVRVRSELLDNLVNSAGEASIYRARMEQQVSGLGSYLGELGQTISRLQGQLRDLEAETEAQIHYSHKDEGPQSEDFDPLEMDRYTMIQELSRSLSESVNDLSSLQNMLGDQVKESETLLLQQSRINTELQEGLVKSRMVRFSGLISRLSRLVRQSSQEVGKKVDLGVTGEDNEVDNKVLDRMVAPLEHLIRNAIAHGIEPPMERVKKSKPEAGNISIDISRDGSDIVIVISDDGAGIDVQKVRARAIAQGLITEDQKLTDSEIIRLILQPGFSTASQVTQMAGRGVGMDVVEVEIKHLGGSLQIESTPNGSRFIMRLPFTLSINRAILVKAGEENYAIPLINIDGVARLDSERLLDAYQLANPKLDYVDQSFSLHYLPNLVGTALHYRGSHGDPRQSVIFCRAGDSRLALHVDELVGNREIVVKNLGKQLSQVKSISGASVLADGSVVLILDIAGLIEQYAENQVSVVYRGQDGDDHGRQHTIMVVDDSITMRRVASKLLQRNDYQVVTAKDGMDALTQLEDIKPDLMLLDIEMPRMDGFELASHMRNEVSLSSIPIIMITSRTGEKHRQRASEIGVDNYMGKPYQEEELLANIKAIIGGQ